MDTYDIVIIGGGPAGLTAGIYAARAALKTVLLEQAMPGGLAATTDIIENYPGFPEGLSGPDLANHMLAQAERFGLEIQYTAAQFLTKTDNVFRITTDNGMIQSKTVIIASGAKPKMPGFQGEQEFHGKGVSYCATCDGAFFRDKTVVVVGGGDSAVEEALFLTKFATKVYIVHRRNELRATKYVQEKAKNNDKIEFILNSVIEAIKGENIVSAVDVKNVETGDILTLEANGVFIYIGHAPSTELVQDMVELDEGGYIITDDTMNTTVPGLFAAGDIRSKTLRQVVTAVSDGAIAAMAAEKYIEQ